MKGTKPLLLTLGANTVTLTRSSTSSTAHLTRGKAMAPSASSDATTDSTKAASSDLTVESLIEDVSIDGMCGVY